MQAEIRDRCTSHLRLHDHDPVDQIERYAIAGGMPLYLRQLAKRGSLKSVVCEELLSPFGFLFDEPREVLEMELSSPAIHFSLLSALARHRELHWEHLLSESMVDNATASRYIRTLEDLHLVQSYNPIFSERTARKHRYRVSDAPMRLWFRFVFPYQEELAAGMRPHEHFARSIQPFLAHHVASAFEDVCRAWVRERYAQEVDAVGHWWGLARHDLRKTKQRTSEDIDVVGVHGSKVRLEGECKWNQRQLLSSQVLTDLRQFKLPALRQVGLDVDSARIALFSRAGFSRDLREAAEKDPSVELIGPDELVRPAA